MKYDSNFTVDLEDAQTQEKYVAKRLSLNVELFGNTKDWDIKEKDGTLHEVKYDKKAAETGNHFVEERSRGKWSGIRITKAKWWHCVLCTGEIITVSVERLRHYMVGYPRLKGGDSDTSYGYIIPLDDLRQLSKEDVR